MEEDIVSGQGSPKVDYTEPKFVFTFGNNDKAQIGNDSFKEVYTPFLLEKLQNENIRTISAGGSISSAVNEEGKMFVWGSAAVILAFGSDSVRVPKKVTSLEENNIFVKNVAVASTSVIILDDKGKLYALGKSQSGETGTGKTSTEITNPMLLSSLRLQIVEQISCGRIHAMCLTSSKEVFSWGSGSHSKLGYESFVCPVPSKITELSGKSISKIACGRNFSAALSEDGQLYLWGSNENWEMGEPGTIADTWQSPTLAHKQYRFKEIACGDSHSLAITIDGHLISWGEGQHGYDSIYLVNRRQLGNGDMRRNTPQDISMHFDHKKVVSVACGGNHSTAISEDGVLYTWGSDDKGQLGHKKKFSTCWTPKPVTDVSAEYYAIQVACGFKHTMVLVRKRVKAIAFEEDNKEPEYDVEDILDKKIERGVVKYFVKWRNYPSDLNTWEPLSNLSGCLEAVQEFENKLKAEALEEQKQRKRVAEERLKIKEDLLQSQKKKVYVVSSSSSSSSEEEAPLLKKRKLLIEPINSEEEEIEKKQEDPEQVQDSIITVNDSMSIESPDLLDSGDDKQKDEKKEQEQDPVTDVLEAFVYVGIEPSLSYARKRNNKEKSKSPKKKKIVKDKETEENIQKSKEEPSEKRSKPSKEKKESTKEPLKQQKESNDKKKSKSSENQEISKKNKKKEVVETETSTESKKTSKRPKEDDVSELLEFIGKDLNSLTSTKIDSKKPEEVKEKEPKKIEKEKKVEKKPEEEKEPKKVEKEKKVEKKEQEKKGEKKEKEQENAQKNITKKEEKKPAKKPKYDIAQKTTKKDKKEEIKPEKKIEKKTTENKKTAQEVEESDWSSDEEWEVESILDKEVNEGDVKYLVKWKGWPSAYNTYEPLENLKSAKEAVEEFERQYGQTNSTTKMKYDRIRELVGGTTTSWIGEPINADKTRTYYNEFKRGSEIFKVGDYVHTLDPNDDTESTYIVARLESMYSDRRQKKYIKLLWFDPPENVKKNEVHQRRELLMTNESSDHESIDVIVEKVEVLTKDEYMKTYGKESKPPTTVYWMKNK